MNLAAYDTTRKIDYTKSWIDPRYKTLYSRELKYYNFYSFACIYNSNLKHNEYYLILHNNINANIKFYPLLLKNNIIKIKLKDIWNKMFYKVPTQEINIDLEVDDIQEDCIIYYMNSFNIFV